MDLDIDSELAVCEAATPGPWRVGDYTHFPDGKIKLFCDEWEAIVCEGTERPEDLEFASRARTGYPEALRRLKRLRELYLASRALTVLVVRGDISIEENNTRYSTIDAEIRQLLDLEETA